MPATKDSWGLVSDRTYINVLGKFLPIKDIYYWVNLYSGAPGIEERVLPFTHGSTTTGGTCPNDISDPIDQDIRIQ